jgi:superfamily I DNA/RNA helicase
MFNTLWWREPEELDEAQQRVAALPEAGRYLVTGKPGSGKTNLLVLRGRYLARRRNTANLKVITWTRLIREFIASGTLSHGLSDDQLQTFLSWGSDALAAVNMEVVLTGSYPEQIVQLMSALEAARNDLRHYDAVLVDETQDYRIEMINLFASLSDRLFFVGDEKQRIYDARGALARAAEITQEQIDLPFHYRNGRRICEVAQALSGENDYVATNRYPEDLMPSRVTLEEHDSLDEQVASLIENLHEQMRVYPGEMLGVMIPYREEREQVVEMLRESNLEEYCQFQIRQETYAAFDEGRPIVVCTVHSAKGLEFRAAHIVAMEGFRSMPRRNQVNLAYIAVTRAKTSLTGYHTGDILGVLRAAFQRGLDDEDLDWTTAF